MKDLSFFLLNKSHMKRGLNNLCTGHASTSTLNQQNSPEAHHRQPTLEEMIMQLDLEEKMAARPASLQHHRMSCVNSSDILRSARNAALNQYPRFSLDGKDAMYRSSFRNLDNGKGGRLPAKVAGERVMWCKPGVVGKLMGLEAMPIPIRGKQKMMKSSCCVVRKQNLMRSSRRQEEEIKRKGVEIKDEVGWPMGRFMY